jgi:hypothetical protein
VHDDGLFSLAHFPTEAKHTLAVVTSGPDEHKTTVFFTVLMPALTPTMSGHIHIAAVEATARLRIDMPVTPKVMPQTLE